jgi:hypothetical protein
MYLEFQDYKELGGKLNEIDFRRAEINARMKIDSFTSSRLRGLPEDDPQWETIRFLILELIDRSYLGKLDGNEYTSVSNDGRSASFESKAGKADTLIKDYLSEVKVDGVFVIDRGGIITVGVKKA